MPTDLQVKATETAQEIVENYPNLVRKARKEDWADLLEIAYMRGWNDSTRERLNERNADTSKVG